MVVYAEVLFAVNLLADYARLLVVCRLVRLRARPVRLLLTFAARTAVTNWPQRMLFQSFQ